MVSRAKALYPYSLYTLSHKIRIFDQTRLLISVLCRLRWYNTEIKYQAAAGETLHKRKS